jgi:hypothetical protein
MEINTHHISRNRQQTNAQTTKRRSGWNYTLQLLVHARLAVTAHDHLLLLKLARHVTRRRSRHLDPSLAQEGARA